MRACRIVRWPFPEPPDPMGMNQQLIEAKSQVVRRLGHHLARSQHLADMRDRRLMSGHGGRILRAH
jgi:hypothetical protein